MSFQYYPLAGIKLFTSERLAYLRSSKLLLMAYLKPYSSLSIEAVPLLVLPTLIPDFFNSSCILLYASSSSMFFFKRLELNSSFLVESLSTCSFNLSFYCL